MCRGTASARGWCCWGRSRCTTWTRAPSSSTTVRAGGLGCDGAGGLLAGVEVRAALFSGSEGGRLGRVQGWSEGAGRSPLRDCRRSGGVRQTAGSGSVSGWRGPQLPSVRRRAADHNSALGRAAGGPRLPRVCRLVGPAHAGPVAAHRVHGAGRAAAAGPARRRGAAHLALGAAPGAAGACGFSRAG